MWFSWLNYDEDKELEFLVILSFGLIIIAYLGYLAYFSEKCYGGHGVLINGACN